ncbi:hypothetical protein FF011L_03170 [Roseimaritima multifibrata]|uniref:Zinc-ribbon domain-containing protein n=1 Tax=Roseimaritima multifibrata TaxID=1930274 RepID=A0A517M9X4_9BACT|nr:zinc ribbon domain-containing protein [Roseimaritima multifibrata]QDS91587.1 hypothetical protein FF011L_03170 [Roseimaritima multifibrata]
MSDQISNERKTAYYIGIAISIAGVLLFLSVFVTGAMNFGNFDNFEGQTRSFVFRAIGGMVLFVAGKIIAHIGARGLAGSGVVLDPKKAREDLKPYSKMTGGMVADALDESGIPEMLDRGSEPKVVIRCRSCQKLNEDDSKFCQECGEPI